MDYPFHPLRKGDPLPTESEICARMQDIREQGLRHPIVLFQGQILVGRTDYLACKRLKIVPRLVVMTYLSDPQAFVIASRAHRLQQPLPAHRVVNRTPTRMQDSEHEEVQPASAISDMRLETQQQQESPVAREQVQSTAVRQNVHNLALRIGIRAAAREYGLKESRVLNWAWRYGWHIGKRKHTSHNPVNRCRLCGQPVVSI